MTISEMTTYSTAWKKGTAWSRPPSTIPIEYMTNAALLWKKGEVYVYDGTRTPPWVPVESPPPPP